MPTLDHIDHIVMTVRDIDATVEFYRQLGLMPEVFRAADGTTRHALMAPGFKINLHPAEAPFAPHAATPAPGAVDICLTTSSPLSGWLDLLGDTVIEGPVPRTGARGPMKSIYCRDPDGNLIELSRYD